MIFFKASKVRKCIEKIRLKAKLKQPPSTTSDSWRTTYERMKAPSILGQLQDNVQINYGIKGLTASDYSDEMTDGMNLASDRDDLKGAWRSVLACGKSLERQLDGDTSGNKKPLLSTLVLFISHAYGLPIPESCFGTNHVMIEEVSTCLLKILDYIENARHFQAKLRDMLFDKAEEGIDADALQKYLDNEGKSIPVRLDEADSLYQSIEIVADWESRLSSVLEPKEGCIRSEDRDELRAVEEFEMEARNHGYISKSLVQLKVRIQKSYKLRNRIMQWKQSCDEGLKTSIKKVAALVREANRVDLMFPEVSNLFTFNRTMEGWIDRANIAIRSRISLVEIKALIRRGEEMPLDLSDYVVKLHDRVRTADEWIGYLSQEVPCPKTVTGEMDMLSWMGEMRKALLDGQHGRLHDLASEGSRIPVEVDAVKLLQVELDAKTWTLKANKWIPKNSDSRRGKLADIEDHVEKASYIREKLALTEKEKEAWILEGEADLISIVEAADTWFDKVRTNSTSLHLVYIISDRFLLTLLYSTSPFWMETTVETHNVAVSRSRSFVVSRKRAIQYMLT